MTLFSAQNASNVVWQPRSARTRWGAERSPDPLAVAGRRGGNRGGEMEGEKEGRGKREGRGWREGETGGQAAHPQRVSEVGACGSAAITEGYNHSINVSTAHELCQNARTVAGGGRPFHVSFSGIDHADTLCYKQRCGVLIFCGTPTATPALKTWTPTPTSGQKSDSDPDSRTYCVTYWLCT